MLKLGFLSNRFVLVTSKLKFPQVKKSLFIAWMKKLIAFPWYIVFLPVFFILHAYNNYFGLIPVPFVAKYLHYYLLLAIMLFFFGWWLFKDRIKSGVFTISFLIIFFFFGSAYDFMQRIHLPSILTSYKFLLVLILVFMILLAILLKRKAPPVKAHQFFFLLFLILMVMEICTCLYYVLSGRKNDPAIKNPPLALQLKPGLAQPDIFFIVFDEYTSSKALKKYFGFDNSALDSSLENDGFYISHDSKSNYNSTVMSMASTLNMQYFNRPLENTDNDARSLLEGSLSIGRSYVPKLLEQQGYEIINYGLFDIGSHKAKGSRPFLEYEARALSLETLWGRIQRDILWNLVVRMPGYSEKKSGDKEYIERNQSNFSQFLTALNIPSSKPRLVLSHLLLPRRPAYVDRNGNPRITSMEDFRDENHDSLYLEQVLYANKLIDSIGKAAIKGRQRPLVLIIEGDHGNRYAAWGITIREKHFMNLNAYYFSDRDYSMLYDSISPVNSFRVVLNKYFNAGLPLLKDSTILLR